MPDTRAYDREEEYLEKQLAEGTISTKEYNSQMRELQRDFRGAVEEEAENAYRDVMNQY